jgi:hypothetical protein
MSYSEVDECTPPLHAFDILLLLLSIYVQASQIMFPIRIILLTFCIHFSFPYGTTRPSHHTPPLFNRLSLLRSTFSWDYILSIAACIWNGQSSQCYSQYKYVVVLWQSRCNKGQQLSFSERLIDSNLSTRSHVPEDWDVHQHHCGNPKCRVNPMFARRQLVTACCVASCLSWTINQV